jgi:Protein of unknown function (DUF3592)
MSGFTEAHTTYLLFLAFGVVGLWRGWRDLRRALASTTWPHAEGEIVGSDVHVDGHHEDGEALLRTVIRYRYDVGGRTYHGERVFFGDSLALRFAGPGKRRLAAYPTGTRVGVAYDPRQPRLAVLEPGGNVAAYLVCAVGAAVALLGVIGLLR